MKVFLASATASLVMRPHPEDFYSMLAIQDLVYEPMLDVDASGVCAGKVADQFLIAGRCLEWVLSDHREQPLDLFHQSRGRNLPSVVLSLSCVNNPPAHQPGSSEHWSRGVSRPLRMDSRMPGTDSRYRVS